MADVIAPTTETDVGQDIVTIKEIEPVEFTDESAGADSVRWNFGDGNTSTERNPIHNYTTNGEFTVIFTGFNDFGEASIEQTITISGIGEEIPGIDVIEDEDPIEPDTYDPGEPPIDEEDEDREEEDEGVEITDEEEDFDEDDDDVEITDEEDGEEKDEEDDDEKEEDDDDVEITDEEEDSEEDDKDDDDDGKDEEESGRGKGRRGGGGTRTTGY